MDDQELFRFLGKSHYTTDAQLRVLEEGLRDAFFKMSTLCREAPQSQLFLHTRDALSHAMGLARVHQLNDVAVFTGNGPVATKLKEFLQLQQWFQTSATNIALVAAEEKIKKFNLNPIAQGEECEKFNSVLREIGHTLFSVAFDTDMTYHHWPFDTYQLASMPVGIYSMVGSNDKIYNRVLLRFTTADDVKCIVSCQVDGCEVYFFHPLEESWVKRTTGMSFAGAADILAAEFHRMTAAAKVIEPESVDLEQELKDLIAQGQEVFKDMKYLPAVVSDSGVAGMGVSKSLFSKESEDYAYVQASATGSPLFLCLFHHATDPRACGHGYFIGCAPQGVVHIQPEAISATVKHELHRRAAERLRHLEDLIRNVKSGDIQLSPFAYLIPPTYFDKSQIQ